MKKYPVKVYIKSLYPSNLWIYQALLSSLDYKCYEIRGFNRPVMFKIANIIYITNKK